MLVLARDFLLNLAAGVATDLSSPSGMMGYLLTIGIIAYAVIAWHKKRVLAGKRGMDSLYVMALALLVIIGATGVLFYGMGLRSAPQAATVAGQNPIPAAVDPWTTLRRNYSGKRKTALDDNLTDLSHTLNAGWNELDEKAQIVQLVNRPSYADPRWEIYARIDNSFSDMRKILARIKEAIWNKLRSQYPDQQNDLDDILVGPERLDALDSALIQSEQSLRAFKNLIMSDDLGTRVSASQLFFQSQEPLSEQIGLFRSWISQCNYRIDEKRKALEHVENK